MTITVQVRQKLGSFDLDASFESNGRLIALFGPSGAGKSSVINFIAGLSRATAGKVVVDGNVLVDTENRIFVLRHKRRIGYVFQEGRLFPHLSVRHNLAYGRWFAPNEDSGVDTAAVTRLLGLEHLVDRMPNHLSGGEKQRVAIGRALLSAPKLLLLDEPLASLDQARKSEIMPYIEKLRDETNIPIIYVSHSIAEVARLATDIVVIASGRVTACGPVSDILQRPDVMRSEDQWDASSVIDMNVVSYDATFDITKLRSVIGEMNVPGVMAALGKKVRLRIRARDVLIALQQPAGISAQNSLHGEITDIQIRGAFADVKINCGGESISARITHQSAASLGLTTGMIIFAVVKTASVDAS